MTSLRLLVLAGWLASPVAAQSVLETDCDRLAGFDHTPRVAGFVGAYVVTDAVGAVAACETAMSLYPEVPFFNLLLARALLTIDADEPRALQLTEASASALPGFATGRLGWLLENGLAGLPVNEGSARAAYQAACAMRADPYVAVSCNNLAMMMIAGAGGPAQPEDGLALLDTLCGQGLGMACVNLGYEVEVGEVMPVDLERANQLYRTACDLGDMMGCNNQGYLLETGSGDMAAAQALYLRACDGGEAFGCSNLGETYRTGSAGAVDGALAEGYLQRGCDGNEVYACYALGQMLAQGDGLMADRDRALSLFARACDLGDTESCDLAKGLP